MYCPNCKEEFGGKFCPECGTKLVEKPAAGLSIGDGNAFNGAINYDASHHVHNEDRSVHNISNTTSTINNITQVEAQKTEMEMMQEKKRLYLEACRAAYEDNVLDQGEVNQLERYRVELGLSSKDADEMLRLAAQHTQFSSQRQELPGIARIKMRQFSEALKAGDAPALLRQLDGMEALAGRFANEELHFAYYLVLAALKQAECIRKYENTRADNYWQMYWTCLAYCKSGDTLKSNEILWSLCEKFPHYPAENSALLAVSCAFLGGDSQEASAYLQELTGDYSPVLQGLAECAYLMLEPETATLMGATEQGSLFYLTQVFGQETSEEKARRKAEEAKRKAEEEAKRKAEEEAKRKAEEEAKRRAEEEAKRRAEEEAKRKAEEEAKRKVEEEAKRKAEVETKRKAEEDPKARKKYEIIKGIGYIPYGETKIKSSAFWGCSSLTNITIPDSVTRIESGAFSGCFSLTSISIPDSVTRIEYDAFSGCKSLTSISIPDSVTKIEREAFKRCSSLTSISIPESVTKIESLTFDGCSSLTSISIPESVTEIEYGAFRGCSSLTSVTIPPSVKKIWGDGFSFPGAFEGCSSLTTVKVSKNTEFQRGAKCAFDKCPNVQIIRY